MENDREWLCTMSREKESKQEILNNPELGNWCRVVPVLTAPPSVLRCDILARKIAI
jgi:hypothetical protein